MFSKLLYVYFLMNQRPCQLLFPLKCRYLDTQSDDFLRCRAAIYLVFELHQFQIWHDFKTYSVRLIPYSLTTSRTYSFAHSFSYFLEDVQRLPYFLSACTSQISGSFPSIPPTPHRSCPWIAHHPAGNQTAYPHIRTAHRAPRVRGGYDCPVSPSIPFPASCPSLSHFFLIFSPAYRIMLLSHAIREDDRASRSVRRRRRCVKCSCMGIAWDEEGAFLRGISSAPTVSLP